MLSGQPVVLTAGAITLGSTVGSDLRAGKGLDPKKVVGGFLAILLCSVVAEADAELGAGLAIALAGTAFVTYGIPALSGSGAGGLVTGKDGSVTGSGSNAQLTKVLGSRKTLPPRVNVTVTSGLPPANATPKQILNYVTQR